MKDIKIKFTGFWSGFNEQQNFFTKILNKHFNVIISDEPDYIFCSVLGEPYDECKYDGVRIHFNGENYTPDFNIHDYGISYNRLDLQDRHLQYPLYLVSSKVLSMIPSKHLNVSPDILKNKPYFCNYIYGASRDYREKAFEVFSTYKTVLSPGTNKNNMPNHRLVQSVDDKLDFLKKCKFTIAFDSTELPGFTTEKIMHGFAAQTIPIYFGDPKVNEHFNKNAFINVADYNYDLEEVLKKIIEIDQNDDLFLKMLREPVFNEEDYIFEKQLELKNFLINIFEQDFDRAFRRSRIAGPQFHNDRLKNYNEVVGNKFYRIIKKFIN